MHFVGFYYKNNIQSSLLTCLCMSHYISCPSHPPLPDHPVNIWWRVQTMTLLLTPLFQSCSYLMVWDNTVGTSTCYGLNGPGIKSQWGRDLLHPSRPALDSIQPPIKWAPGFFPGNKVAGAWRWAPPTLSSPKVKETPLWGLHGLFLGLPVILSFSVQIFFSASCSETSS